MAKIKLNGDTSGYIEISAPAVSGNNTLELGPGTKILTDLDNTFTGVSTFSNGIDVSGGNVLVGTTDATIYNNGDSDSEGIVLRNGEVIDVARKGDLQLTLNRQTNDGPHIGFFRSGSPKTYISTRNDAFCIDTGGLNERLRVTDVGRVLINATTDIVNTSSAKLQVTHTGGAMLALGRDDSAVSANNDLGKIAFFGNDGGSYEECARITCEADGSHASGDKPGRLLFATTADGASSPTERLRIDSAGMVGINMTPGTPGNSTYMLQMYNAGSQCFMSIGNGTSGNGPLNGLVMGVSNAAHYITGRENLPLIFATNDVQQMRLDASGRLLLDSGTDVRIELGTTGSTGTNNRNHLRGDGANMKYNCCSGGGHFFEANGGERMRISSNGHVNIGDGYIVSNSGLHVGRSSGGTAAGESIIAATLGNDSTMVSALLTVKNAGNRGTQGHASGSPLAKFEFNNGTAFEIDKNGYRTLPYQPCAMAYNAQGQHMAGNAVAQFNSTRFNIGNMYNSSNGRMTVPVDGRYLVAYSGLHDYVSQNAIGFDIRINGSNFNGGEGYQECTSSSNSQLSKTLILNLSANDYVQIFIRQSGTQVHQRYGSFSMCLIT